MIKNELEDFEKVVTFSGDEIAIVNADIIKALKRTPIAKGIVYVPLKSSVEDPSFKIVARYDDATLRKLVIVPAAAGEAEVDPTTPPDKRDDLSEDSANQRRGHGGDGPARQMAQVLNPKASRQNRNRLNSKGNRPLIDPSKKIQSRVGQMGAGTGDPNPDAGAEPERRKVKQAESRRRNPNVPKQHSPYVETFCRFLSDVKEGLIQDIENIRGKENILETLKHMRARCFGGWKLQGDKLVNESGHTADPNSWELHDGFVNHKGGKRYDFDLIYEAIKLLEDVTVESTAPVNINSEDVKLFEELILRKLNLE